MAYSFGSAAVLTILLVAHPLTASLAGEPTPVKVGMVRTLFRDMPPETLGAMSKPFRNLLEQQIGAPGIVAHADDPFTLAAQLHQGELNLGVFHGFEFAWVKQRYPELEPLVIAVPTCKTVQALILVRQDSPLKAIADLAGQKMAVPKGTREHCRIYWEHCAGQCPIESCAPEGIEDALLELSDGKVAAALVDLAGLKYFETRHEGRAKRLRALATSEAFPATVIAYRKGYLTDAQVKQYRTGLIGADKTAKGKMLMSLMKLGSFDPIPTEYESLLSGCVKQYPPPSKSAPVEGRLTGNGVGKEP